MPKTLTKHIKIIRSEKLSSADAPRYIVVDAETGVAVNDAGGYGFKSEEAARNAWNFRNQFQYNRQYNRAMAENRGYVSKPLLRILRRRSS